MKSTPKYTISKEVPWDYNSNLTHNMMFLQCPSLHNSLIIEISTAISPEGQFNIFQLWTQEADSEVVITSYMVPCQLLHLFQL